MKLDQKTIEVLKNFSTINRGIVVKEGKSLKTVSETKSVMAQYDNVKFENDFAIYELSNFLEVIKIYKDDPEMKFEEDYVTVSSKGKNSKIKYYFADPDCIVSPQKELEIPESAFEFDLSAENLAEIKEVGSVLKLPDFFIKADGKKMQFGLVDEENSTSNSHIIEAGETDKVFEIYFKEENLKLLPIDFRVAISVDVKGMRLASFNNKKENITYFIVPEEKSNFGE